MEERRSMSDSAQPHIQIKKNDLDQFRDRATALIRTVVWTPKSSAISALVKKEKSAGGFTESSLSSKEDKLSLLLVARRLSQDEFVLSETTNHVLNVVKTGLQVGMHIAGLYAKFSGLLHLMDLNGRNSLSASQQTEFREKHETTSAIGLFVTSHYVVWELSRYKTEEVSSVNVDFNGVPEVNLLSLTRGIDCMVYYYACYLEKSGQVNNDLDMVKMTLRYFEAMAEEVRVRKDSLKHLDLFLDKSYRLDDSEFVINGFESFSGREVASITFNRVDIGEIVGNRDAKHKARRLVERLCCYDPEVKKNPVMDLGGLTTFRMGSGTPGTGKSMQIAATATLLSDICKMIGTPFLFWPFPDNIVSTFQGGSAERATEWFKPLKDPTKIIYAPIDDAENNLEERTRHGVSAGVREVIGVVLRNTEGAYAINYGNSVMELFTNLPEQIDKAVLSRIQDRLRIDGARTVEDFLDQDYLWWRKYLKIDSRFIGMSDPKSYKYLDAQKNVRSLSELYKGLESPTEANIRRIFEQVKSGNDPKRDHEFFARFFHAVQREYPTFSSRDLRNIQRAVDDRIMDFDFEEDWLKDPKLFYLKDYETKKSMLIELMKKNMKGLSFAEIRLQEIIRYIDTMMTINTTEHARKLDSLIADHDLREEAMRILKERQE